MKKGISLVYLAYNESENLSIILPKAKKELVAIGEEYEIIVVDTEFPTDDTKIVCQKLNVRYIPQEYPGFGGAYKTGIKYAKYDKYLCSDSDCSMNPCYVREIYHDFISGNYDIVVGSRYCEGAKSNDSFHHILMSKILNFIFKLIISIPITDMSINFRMHKTEQLKNVEKYFPLKTPNFSVHQELLLKLKILNSQNLNVSEIPIVFEQRNKGKSKRRLLVFIIEYIQNIFMLLELRLYRKLNRQILEHIDY